MRCSDLLSEMRTTPIVGEYNPEHFYALAYIEADHDTLDYARALAEYKLSAESEPYIYKNDLIAGSLRSMCTVATLPVYFAEAAVMNHYPDRNFRTNNDHYAPDYRTAVKLGLTGTMEKIEQSKKAHAGEADRVRFLDECALAVSGLIKMANNYANLATSLIGTDGYNDDDLRFIASNCLAVATRAPETFAEALQLVWLIHISFMFQGRRAMALGRLDQYLYPLFKHDIEAGILTEDRATELLSCVFVKIFEMTVIKKYEDVINIAIGGTSPDGSCDVNPLSYCVLHAVRDAGVPGPNLTARIAENTPDEFYDECLKVIGTGIGYPSMSSDKVNIPALARYGYDEADLYDYCMVGCIENFMQGKQRPWSDDLFKTSYYFEYIFNRGKGLINDTVGLDTGDVSEIKSMDDLLERFKAEIHYGVKQTVDKFLKRNHVNNPDELVCPMMSAFTVDCIGRGLDINNGGAKYPSVHGIGMMAVGTISDSLAAIEKVVFVDKEATMTEIAEAMKANYEGYDELRAKLLAAPKYGNNDDFADKYAVWLIKTVGEEIIKYRTEDGGGIYASYGSNVLNVDVGRGTGATPDGRKAGQTLSDAASPTYGRDTHGATSTVLSLTKPDYRNAATGSVVNQKYSPSMFNDEKRPKLLTLIKTYFQRGGQEIQINATSREILKDAMEHPEKYPTMVVRVSGFSATYVTLNRGVQEDILNRTQQG